MTPFFCGTYGEGTMQSTCTGSSVGVLEVAAYLAAAAAVVGSLTIGLDLNLAVAGIMLILAYAVVRDVRALRRLTGRDRSAGEAEKGTQFTRASLDVRPRLSVIEGGRNANEAHLCPERSVQATGGTERSQV